MFYARRTRSKGSPADVDKAVKVVEEQVIPVAQKISGFTGGYWLGDRSTGDGISFTFFDSKEALEGSRSAADQVRGQAAQAIGADVISVEHFEVVARTGDKVHSNASHARVIEFGGDAAQLDAVIKRIEEGVIPALRQMPGFLGGFWIADRSTGKGMGVSLFDSQASVQGSADRANQMRAESARITGATVGEPRNYEVIARALTMSGKPG